jgi:GrpB-like predicted nucleotidyltransferase (UPF0157 family)
VSDDSSGPGHHGESDHDVVRRDAGVEQADWPAWATAPIELVPPDPSWSRRAVDLAADVARRMGPSLEGAVEHVGSTAVPGLVAKPILDLLAPVRSLAVARDVHRRLIDAGWELVPPELDARPWRRLYVLPAGDRRLAHLHLVEYTHPRAAELLRFRDELRRRPELVAGYARHKAAAAAAHADDREGYTAAKSSFVAAVLGGTAPPDDTGTREGENGLHGIDAVDGEDG